MIEDSIAGLDDVLRLRDSPAAPPPVDLSQHYSESTKLRVPSKMKEYYKFFAIPGIGNLAGGTSHQPRDGHADQNRRRPCKLLLKFALIQVFPTHNTSPTTPSRHKAPNQSDGHRRQTDLGQMAAQKRP